MIEQEMRGCLRTDVLKTAVAERFSFDIDVVVHKSIDSTNNWSIQQCRAGKVLPFACFTEEQTEGKGRRGKQWLMSAGYNIAMSISWPYAISQQLHLLPMSIALAIVGTLETLDLQQVQIKWPNDVYVRGKKIAGILIETVPAKNGSSKSAVEGVGPVENNQTAVVIGVGLNYDMSAFRLKSSKHASTILPGITDILHESLKQNTGQNIDREFVASLLLQNVVAACQRFQRDAVANLTEFRARYDFCKNKTVEVLLDNQQTLSGLALGVNDAAELLVEVDGEERVFNSAEVSVKACAQ